MKLCPKIKEECVKEDCMFFQRLFNNEGKEEYNCVYVWKNILLTELISAIQGRK